ncbi:PTS system maltose- and glucose-specific EIICB component, partial [Klebsiella variicola]
MGVFPAARKNLYAARSVALVLWDHAGDRQLVK